MRFAGYGISAAQQVYDDYKEADDKVKIVVKRGEEEKTLEGMLALPPRGEG